MAERSNQEWLADLRQAGPDQEAALADLSRRIRGSLPFALSKYLQPSDPAFDALADETVQETLLKVLDKLDSFEGRSQFTTWVYKIAVHQALSELRRKRWESVRPMKQPSALRVSGNSIGFGQTIERLSSLVADGCQSAIIRSTALTIVRKARIGFNDHQAVVRNVAAWVRRHIRYQVDPPNIDVTYRPEQILAMGAGDCEDMMQAAVDG